MKETKKQPTKLEENIQWLYDSILCEGDWDIGNYYYHFIQAGDYMKEGWNVYIEDLRRKDRDTIHWYNVSPHEYFKTRFDMITQFKIKEDGRTFLEYICDEDNEPRVLVPPLPEIYPDI